MSSRNDAGRGSVERETIPFESIGGDFPERLIGHPSETSGGSRRSSCTVEGEDEAGARLGLREVTIEASRVAFELLSPRYQEVRRRCW